MGILLETARVAVNKLFADTSVSKETTKGDLVELRDEIDNMIDSLEE